MAAIRILSIIGLPLCIIGFLVGVANYNPTDLDAGVSSWAVILALYFAALCIVNLSVIKVKTRDDKIKKLEADLKAMKETIPTLITAEEKTDKEEPE
ncbi:hypothetical protein ES703_123308 [subsurface metagenome]